MLEVKITLDPATGRLHLSTSQGVDRADVLDMLEACRQAVHQQGHNARARARLAVPSGVPIPDLRAN